MTEKYYTPKIEEFHVGFEYYVLGMIGGEKEEFHRQKKVFTKEDFNSKECRIIEVKYLDSEDIESLGWKINEDSEENGFILKTEDNLFYLYHRAGNHVYKSICSIYKNGTSLENAVCYRLEIKNKSELRKIMQMIGII